MLKQTITYRDLEGQQVTEDFYFHMNKAEMVKLFIYNNADDPEAWLTEITTSKNGQVIVDTFENIVRMAYGVKDENGKRFKKGEQVWLDFYESDAYSEFFVRLVTNANFAAEFVNGIMPADLRAEASAEIGELSKKPVEDVELPVRDYSTLTQEEIIALPREELVEAFRQRLQIKNAAEKN